MKLLILRILRHPRLFWVKRAGFFLRGVLYLGRRHRCSCCDWPLRGFVDRSSLWKANSDGYCPRCNAKARHRRHALFLKQHGIVRGASARVLEIAPWWALSRWLRRIPAVEHVGVDLVRSGPHVNVVGDLTSLPCKDGRFDVVICIHVLEHVDADRSAMAELKRVLKPGGVLFVSVPIRLDRPTHEDPSITDPEERLKLFGERGHVRYYGSDFPERLAEAGLSADMDRADSIPASVRHRFGLRLDEQIFTCRRRPGG